MKIGFSRAFNAYSREVKMDLPGYDAWKTHNPDDDRCEFCGVHPRELHGGWQPARCTGECGKKWRDPDVEYERMRDEL